MITVSFLYHVYTFAPNKPTELPPVVMMMVMYTNNVHKTYDLMSQRYNTNHNKQKKIFTFPQIKNNRLVNNSL